MVRYGKTLGMHKPKKKKVVDEPASEALLAELAQRDANVAAMEARTAQLEAEAELSLARVAGIEARLEWEEGSRLERAWSGAEGKWREATREKRKADRKIEKADKRQTLPTRRTRTAYNRVLEKLLENAVEKTVEADGLEKQATIAKLEYHLWAERFQRKQLEQQVEALEARLAPAACSEHVNQPKRLKN